ncbi:MAG: hypothetical protein IPO60_18225 [Flavobacteriales bacterium]|nr:hypothetical protein [Flavobacteriales bacterium]
MITLTLLKLMARSRDLMGESSQPNTGYSTPAAMGNAQSVVTESEEQVLLDVAHCARCIIIRDIHNPKHALRKFAMSKNLDYTFTSPNQHPIGHEISLSLSTLIMLTVGP